MLATPNLVTGPRQELPPWILRSLPHSLGPLFLALLLSVIPALSARASESAADRAKRLYDPAQQRLKQNPDDVTNAWQFARACFDCAEVSGKPAERANFAEQGIAACRKAISNDPNSAPAHYYLALNLGQLAQTKSLGALKLVEEMEKELKAAIALDPTFDFAGPHRSIGLLYAEAPGWPISIGNRNAAEKHLLKAVGLSPEYPDNQLALLETYLKWDNRSRAKAHLEETRKQIEAAREKFNGEDWELSWRDWDRRWAKIPKKLG